MPDSSGRFRPWVVVALAAILVAGGLVRAAYLGDLRNDPLYVKPALDAELHDYWAKALVSGDWTVPPRRHDPDIPSHPFFRPPGYAYFLAVVYGLTGGDPVTTRWVQFVLGLGTSVLGFLLARRLAGVVAGLVAAIGLALAWPLIFFEGELLDPCLLAALTLGALLVLTRARDRRGPGWAAAGGLMIGAMALVRPNALAFLPAAAAWLAWTVHRRDAWRPALRAAGALIAGGALAIAPVTLRNYRASGEWVLISANGGINFLVGNNAASDGIHAAVPDIERIARISGWTCFDYPLLVEGLSERIGRPLGYAEASRVWAAEGMSWIRENPGRFAALLGRRAALFLGPSEAGDRDLDLAREASPTLRRLPGRFPWVLGFAIAGFVAMRRRGASDPRRPMERVEIAVLLAAFALTYTASFLPFFFSARYRAPLLAALLVVAACGLVETWRSLRSRNLGEFLSLVVPAVSIGLIASLNLAGREPPRSEWHYQRGNAYRDAGRADDALREYSEAVRLGPSSATARNDLALALRAKGRVGDAFEHWDAAVRADPTFVPARFNRAQTLAALGRFPEAIEEYRQVLALHPRYANAHLSLGTALLQTGRVGEALEHHAEAERLAPDDPMVAYVVGRSLLSVGRAEEGVARLRRALTLDPDYEPAKQALATAP